MTRRCLFKIALFVLLGAIVNVAVAWACVLNHGDINETDGRAGWLNRTTAGTLKRYRSRNVTLLDFVFGGVDAPNDSNVTPSWFEEIVSPFHLDDLSAAAAGCRLNEARGVVLQSSGWPWQGMAARIDVNFDRGAPIYSDVRGGIRWREKSIQDHWPLVLPLRPLWPGFAINTVFYAGVVWLLLNVRAVQRWRRIKRGLCPKCAYDLRGSDAAVCPECGATVNRIAP